MIRALWRLLGLARRSLTLLVILALLVTNVLAFTSSAFVGLVSAAASTVGVTTVHAARAAATKSVARRLVGRTVTRGRNIVRRLPAKIVPVVGGVAVATFAVFDLQDACATLDLAAELDAESAEDLPETVTKTCAMTFGDGWDLLDYAETYFASDDLAASSTEDWK